nr:transposase family protein [Prescottella equi]
MILSVALSAVCAGARSFTAIAEWAADAPADVLARLGIQGRPPSDRRSAAPPPSSTQACWTIARRSRRP